MQGSACFGKRGGQGQQRSGTARTAVSLPQGRRIALANGNGRRVQAALLAHAEPALVLAAEEFLPGLTGCGYPARPVGDHLTGQRLPWDADRPLPGPDDVYALIRTCGTSGTPKAATVTHRAAMHVADCYQCMLALTECVQQIGLSQGRISAHRDARQGAAVLDRHGAGVLGGP